ncbi:YgdI/YgdR family lipoprotein [Govanella unica]
MTAGKRLLAGLVLMLAVPSLVACSGGRDSEYIMGLRDGRLLVTRGKPQFDDKAGVYNYRGQDGIKGSIGKDEVVQIIER